MKGDLVPDSDHIARYCGGSSVESDGTINRMAFRLRKDEGYLSVNWLEFLEKTSREEAIAEVRNVLRKKLTLGSRSRIAVADVGSLINHIRAERILNVQHEPELPDEPSHSGIFGYGIDDGLIELMIAEVFHASYPSRLV